VPIVLLFALFAATYIPQMERIHQMNVIPDVLPDLHPSFDLHITFMTALREYSKTKKMYMDVVPGVFLTPEQVRLSILFSFVVYYLTMGCWVDEETP